MLLYPIGSTQALRQACQRLHKSGYPLTDHPCPEITHLILDVPSFRTDGLLRNGEDLQKTLSMVPTNVSIIGGNLNHPVTEQYRKFDLLQDPFYLAKNAEITADCAVRLAMAGSDRVFADAPSLVIGWGRIGKSLTRKLAYLGSAVTVAARSIQDRALLEAAGTQTITIAELTSRSKNFHLIFNTVPAMLPPLCPAQDTLIWDLASCQGITEPKAAPARGLPGTMVPYSSGKLIAQTIIKLLQEEPV